MSQDRRWCECEICRATGMQLLHCIVPMAILRVLYDCIRVSTIAMQHELIDAYVLHAVPVRSCETLCKV